MQAFALNAFNAFDVLWNRHWCPGEAVDVYLADIRRLAKLAGVESDNLVGCSFICGLPVELSSQLRAAAQVETKSLDTILKQARLLMSFPTISRLHEEGHSA